eukprot:831337-Alexandrium_andersonii.AAC.1
MLNCTDLRLEALPTAIATIAPEHAETIAPANLNRWRSPLATSTRWLASCWSNTSGRFYSQRWGVATI